MNYAMKITFGESVFLLLASGSVFNYLCHSLKDKYHQYKLRLEKRLHGNQDRLQFISSMHTFSSCNTLVIKNWDSKWKNYVLGMNSTEEVNVCKTKTKYRAPMNED